MILILGGTYDSRKLTEALLNTGYRVLYSSVTEYNVKSLPKNDHLEIAIGKLEQDGLYDLIINQKIEACVDATHPYAGEVSHNAIDACFKAGIHYLRMERPRLIDDGANVFGFDTYEEAVKYLNKKEGKILLTTGSRQLEYYEPIPKERIVIRVLPTSSVLKKCEDLGYKPKSIIAMQGPFSYQMNVNMIREYNIRYLVTKDGGNVGGAAEKINAASDCDVQVIFIKRPTIDYPIVCSDINGVIKQLSGDFVTIEK
ncbi:MAG: precorrin-6A reductase [Bacteroidales bacterium]